MFTSNFGRNRDDEWWFARWFRFGVPNSQTQNFDETTPFLGLHLLLPARKTSFLGYLRLKMHGWSMLISFLGLIFYHHFAASPYAISTVSTLMVFLWDLGKADFGSFRGWTIPSNPITSWCGEMSHIWSPHSLPEFSPILTFLFAYKPACEVKPSTASSLGGSIPNTLW